MSGKAQIDIMQSYSIDAITNCWNWNGPTNGVGYGRFKQGMKMVYAHREMYERIKGPIVTGLDLDHICRNRNCINPAHLEPVTRLENLSRGDNTKLNLQKANEIRTRVNNGEDRYNIAREFRIDVSQISRIMTRRIWNG